MKDIERLTGVRAMTLGLPDGFRAAVAALPPPAKDERKEQPRGGRGGGHPGGGRTNYAGKKLGGNNGGTGRNGETRQRTFAPQGGWSPVAGPRDDTPRSDAPRSHAPRSHEPRRESRPEGRPEGRVEHRRPEGERHARPEGGEYRGAGHKRGGPPVAANSTGRDGQKPRNYGPKKGGVGGFRGAVKRAG
jgi:ATP-dependent RNA helicase RhlE